ncbi:MAG TPA: hypothetical protein VKT83_18030 [bacterium]|nr:hypothetical protein [bacterium]
MGAKERATQQAIDAAIDAVFRGIEPDARIYERDIRTILHAAATAADSKQMPPAPLLAVTAAERALCTQALGVPFNLDVWGSLSEELRGLDGIADKLLASYNRAESWEEAIVDYALKYRLIVPYTGEPATIEETKQFITKTQLFLALFENVYTPRSKGN